MTDSPAWENLDQFLNPRDFGQVVTINLANGSIRQVNAIFDDPYFDDTLGEYNLDISAPRILAKMTDLAGVNRGDSVTVAGVQYDVLAPAMGDGIGMGTLKMARAV
jgi:hypothetical protein